MGYDILRYRAALSQHRESFLLNCKAELAAFDMADKTFARFASALSQAILPGHKKPVHLLPWIHLMHRHARNAFESITTYQSHQAWTVIRPFVEAPLILGKWLDDPQNAVIWMSRNAGKTSRKEYKDAYSGDALRSQALPNAEAIRNTLMRLDDDFIWTNSRYYTHAVVFAADGGRPPSLPSDSMENESDHRTHLYALLHLLWFIQRSTGQMLAAKFGDKPEFRVDLEKFQREFGPAAADIARQNETHKATLVNLGLWPHELLHTQRPA